MSTLSEVKVPTNKTPKPPPTPTHEIEVSKESLQGNYYTFPEMTVGETVRFFSNEGEVTIHLPGVSPFRTDQVTGTQVPGGVILTLVQASEDQSLLSNDKLRMKFGCSLTLPGGTVFGWPTISGAGGEPHVKQP